MTFIARKRNKYYAFLCARAWTCGCPCACACARVVLLIQRATRMRHILSFVVFLAQPNVSTLSRNWHYFWKKGTEHKTRVLIFSTEFV